MSGRKNTAQVGGPRLHSSVHHSGRQTDDIDDLLAEFNAFNPTENVPDGCGTAQEQNDLETGDLEETNQPQSATALKNKLKRQKKKAAVQQKKGDEEVEGDDIKLDRGKIIPKAKTLSGAAKAAKQRLAQAKELQEAQREVALEAEAAAQVEKHRIEAETKEAATEAARKREERASRRAQLRAEGRPVTAAERARAAKREAVLARLQVSEATTRTVIQERGPPNIRRRKKKTHLQENPQDEVDYDIVEEDDETDPLGPPPAPAPPVPDDWEHWMAEGRLVEPETNQSVKPKKVTHAARELVVVEEFELTNKNESNSKITLRSPICCILGHVDTGKTKLLDHLRSTSVQANEAGGITQQIGSTFFPRWLLESRCKVKDSKFRVGIPGLLIIDTPGHASFNNLRKRGSSLCDIAILVIDIMHGLEDQTRESLALLRRRKCPFIVALNKIDRLYGWVSRDALSVDIQAHLATQAECVRQEFQTRTNDIIVQLGKEGITSALTFENVDRKRVVSLAPTSAVTGEGIPGLLHVLTTTVQERMADGIAYDDSEFQCTVLEVKNIEGHGTTIDVILIKGILREGDRIVICGLYGPIVTNIRALLTPQPMRELRIKSEYIHHKMIQPAQGLKISAPNMDDAVAGTSILKVNSTDDLEEAKNLVMEDMTDIFSSVDRSGTGVYVVASTLGALEALLKFLGDSKIPVFAVALGTIFPADVKKCSIMKEKGKPEFATMLAFDVTVDPEAVLEANRLGVKVITANIIYHLFDAFEEHMRLVKEEKRKAAAARAIFPCELSIVPNCVFNKRDPLILGVRVVTGTLHMGTPLAVPEKENLKLGVVSSIEKDKKAVDSASKGMEVCVKISGDPHITFGRHFESANKIYSLISRTSIDTLKELYRDQVPKEDWHLIIQLKKYYSII